MSWGASNFTWGAVSGSLATTGVILLGFGNLIGIVMIGGAALCAYMARSATRPLFSERDEGPGRRS